MSSFNKKIIIIFQACLGKQTEWQTVLNAIVFIKNNV